MKGQYLNMRPKLGRDCAVEAVRCKGQDPYLLERYQWTREWSNQGVAAKCKLFKVGQESQFGGCRSSTEVAF